MHACGSSTAWQACMHGWDKQRDAKEKDRPAAAHCPVPLSNHRPPTRTTTACLTKTLANKHVWRKKWAADAERRERARHLSVNLLLDSSSLLVDSTGLLACLHFSRLEVFCARQAEAGGWPRRGKGIVQGRAAGGQGLSVHVGAWGCGGGVLCHSYFFLVFLLCPEGDTQRATMTTIFWLPPLSIPPSHHHSLPSHNKYTFPRFLPYSYNN
jgi:hypothetical protein